jgi:HemY protein
MLRLIVTFSIIIVAALTAVWLADLGGAVSLTLSDVQIEVPLLAAVVGLLALGLVLAVVFKLFNLVFSIPQKARKAMRMRRRRMARETLATGLIAAEAGETRKALTMASKAEKLSGETALVKLLEARAAIASSNQGQAAQIFKNMLGSPRTKLLGFKGLYDLAWQEHRFVEAEEFARQAADLSTEAAWPLQAMLHFHTQHEEWDAALGRLQALSDAKHMERAEARRLRAVLLTAKAMSLPSDQLEAAFVAAREAHSLAVDLVPAAGICAEIAERKGDLRKARKVLEASYKAAPHPDLASQYVLLEGAPSAQERLKRAKKLAAILPEHRESKLLLAENMIDAGDFGSARVQLLAVLQSAPSVRAYQLMAELEEAESGDIGRAREWLARAVSAPRDETWVADGVSSDNWAPIGPRTGRLDAYEWKAPVTSLAPINVLSADDVAAIAAMPDLQAANIKPAVVVETEPNKAAQETPEKASDNQGAPVDQDAETVEPDEIEVIKLERQPDDPGAAIDEDEKRL